MRKSTILKNKGFVFSLVLLFAANLGALLVIVSPITKGQVTTPQPVSPQASLASSIGDVKYSVLDPDQFARQNGPGWVLMKGQDIQDSDLFKLTGRKTLPDARGIFIRGMNLGRAQTEGDADGNRDVGIYQFDSFKHHSHVYLYGNDHGRRHTYMPEGQGDAQPVDSARRDSEEAGDKETRPRNIALYTYIKVNR